MGGDEARTEERPRTVGTDASADGAKGSAPRASTQARLVLVPVALAAAGVAVCAAGPVPLGVVLAVFGVLVGVAETLIGSALVKAFLAPHANVFTLMSSLKVARGSGEASCDDSSSVAVSDSEDAAELEEREIDEAVGWGLTRAAAERESSLAGLSPEESSAMRVNILRERRETYAWLSEQPLWERVSITAEDGETLVAHALVCRPDSPRWAVLCHGYAGTWGSMMPYARSLGEQGFNLLVPDMRAHGESGGRLIGLGLLDRRDVVLWARCLVEGGLGLPVAAAPCTDILLLGQSMGACAVCSALGEPDLPAEVRVAVADSAVSSGCDAVAGFIGALGLPVHPLIELLRLNLKVRPRGYDIADVQPERSLGRSQVPLILFHGGRDLSVPVSSSEVLARAAGSRARLVVVPGGGHCTSSLADPGRYWGELIAFVEPRLS